MILTWNNDSAPPYTIHFLPSDGWFVSIRGTPVSDWSPMFPTRAAAVEWAEDRELGVRTAKELA